MSNEALYGLMHEGEDADLALTGFSSPRNPWPLACELGNILFVMDEAARLKAILIRA
jgi:hypothetical protein